MDTYTFQLFLRGYDIEQEEDLLQKDRIELRGHYRYRVDYDSLPLTGEWNPTSGDITLRHEKDGKELETFQGKVQHHFQKITGEWTNERNGRRLDFSMVKVGNNSQQQQFIWLYQQIELSYNPAWSVDLGIKNKGICLANLEGAWNAQVSECSNLTLDIYHTYSSTGTYSIENIVLQTWRTLGGEIYLFESEHYYSYTEKLLEGFSEKDLSKSNSSQRGLWMYQPSDSTFINIWEESTDLYNVYWDNDMDAMIFQIEERKWRFGNYPYLLPVHSEEE